MLGSGDSVVSKNDRFLSFPDFSIRTDKKTLQNGEAGWPAGENSDSLKRQMPMGFGANFIKSWFPQG